MAMRRVEEGSPLLLHLALLLVELLLLEILDLGVNVRDAVVGRSGGHEICRHLVMAGCRRGQGRGLASDHGFGPRQHVGRFGVGHHGIGAVLLGVSGLEGVEVELHTVRHCGHAGHIEVLLEVIVGAGSHVMVLLRIPCRGRHHDEIGAEERQGAAASLDGIRRMSRDGLVSAGWSLEVYSRPGICVVVGSYRTRRREPHSYRQTRAQHRWSRQLVKQQWNPGRETHAESILPGPDEW